MSRKRPKHLELLAPGGSFAGVKAAFAAGADAVYMGGDRFSARAYAESAAEHSLERAIDYAHIHGKQLYLTVNTLIKQQEMEQELYEYLLPLYEQGLDAVLVQDAGAAAFIKREFPELPLHASTQMTVTSAESARMLQKMGFERVVAARELSLAELSDIYEQTGMELEAFVHGAICYCYSGQCLYSGVIGGRSGNRGRCAQPCRLPYQAYDSQGKRISRPKEGYLLSLKDMCTLSELPQMAQAGVMSFKIEGRMKSPLYTAGVVSIYRKYLDRYLENGTSGWKVEEKDLYALSQYFDRGGFTSRYLTAHNGRDMMALTEKAKLRTPDPALMKETEKKYINQELKTEVQVAVTICSGDYGRMFLDCNGISVETVTEELVSEAHKRPLLQEDVIKQVKKTGGTPFEVGEVNVYLSDNAFMPVQALNVMRREAFSNLEQEILKSFRRTMPKKEDVSVRADENPACTEQISLAVQIADLKYLPQVLASDAVQYVYADSACMNYNDISQIAGQCHSRGKKLYIMMPRIFRQAAKKELASQYRCLKAADGIVAGSLDVIQALLDFGISLPVVLDHTLYSWNREAVKQLTSLPGAEKLVVERLCAPLELNEKELAARGMAGSELFIYGYLPMMVTAGCIRKTTGKCTHGNETLVLKDRKGIDFPVVCSCKYCYNQIYNSLPCDLIDRVREIRRLNPDTVRISLTVESSREAEDVLHSFEEVFLKNGSAARQRKQVTRGHFARGVQ